MARSVRVTILKLLPVSDDPAVGDSFHYCASFLYCWRNASDCAYVPSVSVPQFKLKDANKAWDTIPTILFFVGVFRPSKIVKYAHYFGVVSGGDASTSTLLKIF